MKRYICRYVVHPTTTKYFNNFPVLVLYISVYIRSLCLFQIILTTLGVDLYLKKKGFNKG